MTEDDLSADTKALLDTVKMVSNIVTELGKSASIISVPISTILLARYLSTVSAPLPSSGSTLTTLLGVLMVMMVFIALTLGSSMLWVGWQVRPFVWSRLRQEAPHLRLHIFPLRWKPRRERDLLEKQEVLRRSRRFAGKAFSDYGMVYAPFVVVCLATAFATGMNWQFSGWSLPGFFFVCSLPGAAISAGVFYYCRCKPSPAVRAEGQHVRLMMFTLVSMAESWVSTAILVPFLAVSDAIGRAEGRWFGIELLVAILFVHLFANVLRLRPTPTIIMCIGIQFWVISAPLGLALYPAAAFRVLGIGGGLPREVTLQELDRASGKVGITSLTGCVLLTTGDGLVIHPTSDPDECILARMLHDSFAIPPRFNVVVYPASAVVQASTWFKHASR